MSQQKIKFNREEIDTNKNDFKTLGNTVNETCRPTKKNSKIRHLGSNEENVHDENPIAEIFNEHYQTIREKVAQKLNPIKSYKSHWTNNISNSFLSPMCENEIGNIITLKKSPAIHGTKSETLKSILDVIVKPLTHIINKSYNWRISFNKNLFFQIRKP